MSKQTINLGSVVDDYTGDYLRQGGQKINANFDEIYSELGDTSILFPAGAWKSFATSGSSPDYLEPAFGSQYDIDTTLGPAEIRLPAATAADEGKVIKIRDIYGTWAANNVLVVPEGTSSINGDTSTESFDITYTEATFVYTSGDDWKYVPGIRINTSGAASSNAGVQTTTFTATAGQILFSIPAGYNTNAVFVYRNGVMLFYSETSPTLDATSDYGSQDLSGNLVVLNGTNIRLRDSCNAGDIITVQTYTETVATATSSYVRYSSKLVSQIIEPSAVTTLGQTIVRPAFDNTTSNNQFTLQEFGATSSEEFNVNSTQIFLNGTLLTQAGTADLSASPFEGDYQLSTDGSGNYNTITFSSNINGDPNELLDETLRHGDIITIVYFNNEIGSILPWTGLDSIKSRGDDVWLNTETVISQTNRIGYSVTSEAGFTPAASNVTAAPDQLSTTVRTLSDMFNLIYPIGTVYENASNSANPGTYIGLGTWRPYAEGATTFGYDSSDSDFNDTGSPAKVGIKQGSKTVTLLATNIPELSLSKDVAVLYNDGNTGEINISGCLPSPNTSGGADVASISSETVVANDKAGSPTPPVDSFSILPPHIISYKWVRVQ